MNARTWTYGTRLKATVEMVKKSALSPLCPAVTMLTDELGEGHVIVAVAHALEPVRGAEVVMEFTKGGASGGFWRIVE